MRCPPFCANTTRVFMRHLRPYHSHAHYSIMLACYHAIIACYHSIMMPQCAHRRFTCQRAARGIRTELKSVLRDPPFCANYHERLYAH